MIDEVIYHHVLPILKRRNIQWYRRSVSYPLSFKIQGVTYVIERQLKIHNDELSFVDSHTELIIRAYPSIGYDYLVTSIDLADPKSIDKLEAEIEHLTRYSN